MTPVLNGKTRRAARLPRFLHGDWFWVGISSATDILIALLGFTSILMLRPDLIDALGLRSASIAEQAVTTVERYTGIGFLALLPAVWIIMDVIKRLVQRGEEPLDQVQIGLMRRAGLHGWVIDFVGDGSYDLYGPDGEREQFGDLADVEWFVTTLEDQHDQPNASLTPHDGHHCGVGSESGAVSALDG